MIERKRESSPVFISQLVDEYNDFENRALEENTIKDYRHKCNVITRNFGECPVQLFTHDMIERWALASELCVETIMKVLRHLLKIINKAFRKGLIDFFKHQTFGIKEIRQNVKQKLRKTKDPVPTLSVEQVINVFNLSKDKVEEWQLRPLHLAFMLHFANNSARTSEFRALAVDDVVEFNGQRKLEINRASSITCFKTPKITDGVAHSVDIYEHSHTFIDELTQNAKQYEIQEIDIYEKGQLVRKDKVQFLLVNPKTGQPYTAQQYRDGMKKLQALANIERPNAPMYFRNSYATISYEGGVELKSIRGQLNHTEEQTLQRNYLRPGHIDTKEQARIDGNKLAKIYDLIDNQNHNVGCIA